MACREWSGWARNDTLQWILALANISERREPGLALHREDHLIQRRQDGDDAQRHRRLERRAPQSGELEHHRRIDDRELHLAGSDFFHRRRAVAGEKCQRPFVRALLTQLHARLEIGKILWLTRREATSSIKRERVVCGCVRKRVGFRVISSLLMSFRRQSESDIFPPRRKGAKVPEKRDKCSQIIFALISELCGLCTFAGDIPKLATASPGWVLRGITCFPASAESAVHLFFISRYTSRASVKSATWEIGTVFLVLVTLRLSSMPS